MSLPSSMKLNKLDGNIDWYGYWPIEDEDGNAVGGTIGGQANHNIEGEKLVQTIKLGWGRGNDIRVSLMFGRGGG